ncbi:MAG: ATP-binding protein [Bacteroidota bacterium]|nr:ATP-binding protein [Bacteroidota bacterium]
MRVENQHTEFKQVWKDAFLKSICAFANAQGGTLYVGMNDKGEVTGLPNYAKLLEDLPNKIRDILGLIPQTNHKQENNKDYLEIIVQASKTPVSYHGHFYYRSGSTIQDLSGGALEHFLLAKRGKKWDGVVAE